MFDMLLSSFRQANTMKTHGLNVGVNPLSAACAWNARCGSYDSRLFDNNNDDDNDNTYKAQETHALSARSAATEKADGDDEAANCNQRERHVINDQQRPGWIVAEEGRIGERVPVDVDPQSESEQSPSSQLRDTHTQAI